MAIPSAVSNHSVAQTTELVENIRNLLSPFAKEKKDDFAQILDLVRKLASETPVSADAKPVDAQAAGVRTQPLQATAGTPGATPARISDDLAYGFVRGQFAPGTNLPVRIGWDQANYAATPKDMPRWDGRIPPGVPNGSVPFYKTSGGLAWFGLNGNLYDSRGELRDNTLANFLAERNGMTVNDYIKTIHAAATAVDRPLTQSELYRAQADDTGGRYATYKPVVTPEVEREAALRASLTSPYGYGVGQIVPGTELPTWVLGDGTSELSVADMPAWDGRRPEGAPVGSVPFYSTNGALRWLAGNGNVYNSRGWLTDNSTVNVWAARNAMSVDALIAAVQAAGMSAGRALTLSEVASAGSGVA